MRILIIVSAIILAVIGHRFYRLSKANTQFSINMDDLNAKLDEMKLENKKLRDLIQREPPKKIADLATKERALAKLAPIATRAHRFKPDDSLMAFLERL